MPLASGAGVDFVQPQPGGPLIVNRQQLKVLEAVDNLSSLERAIPATPDDAGALLGFLISGSPAVQAGKSVDSVLDELGFY